MLPTNTSDIPATTATPGADVPTEAEKIAHEFAVVAGSGVGYFLRSLIRGIGSSLGRQIGRSIFGGLFGNARNSRNRY